MCGIAGALGVDRPGTDRVRRTLARLRRRGPDASGVFTGHLGDQHLTLLHTRLSIIDLDQRANQPFERDDCVLVYNGELYNYLELRRELEAAGLRFATHSDTEVVLNGYLHFGTACFDRFEGMWALALFDGRRQRLLLSRDRFGEKPLYYWRRGGTLYFASEVKALVSLSGAVPEPDTEQVRRYLVNGYRSLHKHTSSFFHDVHALPPATVAEMSAAADPEPKRYWRLVPRPRAMSMADAVEGTRHHLLRTTEWRLRADVPIACCLSGGVDSSVLAGAAHHAGKDIHAFSVIDGDERYNEAHNIRATVRALGCQLHVTHTSPDGFLDRMAELVAYHDAPVATISYYVHSFLSQAISEAGFKVAVSGTGADELFTGYYDHYGYWLAEMSDRPDFPALVDDWKAGYGNFVRNPLLQDPLRFKKDPSARDHIYLGGEQFSSLLTEPFAEDFVEQDHGAGLLRGRMMNELFDEVVPVILAEDDLNSMRWSVENRSPYLDRELVEFTYSVPSEHLIANGRAKWLLREAGRGLVPDEVRLDQRKRGFNASIDSLLARDDQDVVDRLLAPSPIFDIVRRDALAEFLKPECDLTDNSLSKFMFSFVSAKLFLETVADWAAEGERSAA